MFMENYEEYAKTARVYCNVYARKKPQSPVVPAVSSSENQQALPMSGASPEKKSESAKEAKEPKEAGKGEAVLGSLTLNPATTEHKSPTKQKGHAGAGEKKKWMKRI